jgi:hypothetical protein
MMRRVKLSPTAQKLAEEFNRRIDEITSEFHQKCDRLLKELEVRINEDPKRPK